MATPHIEAKKGDIAETILLPGDPLRAKFIADNYLEDPVCYNNVRGMLGFTGTFRGRRVSVQGTGMGIPSISIYAHELINEYGVKNLIRVGSCGSLQENVKVRDLIIAQSASTNSGINRTRFKGMDYAPTADFSLVLKAHEIAESKGIRNHVGNILSSDSFYDPENPEDWKLWARHGVLGVEMEASGLYTVASRFGCRALAICTVSDSLVSGEETTSEERQNTFRDMMEVALRLA